MTPRPYIASSPLKREWRIFLMLILACAALLGYVRGIGQTDRLIYDNLVKVTHRPAIGQVAIIAIDKVSIASLGRWPWERRVHADLLDILSRSKAKAIGMDIIFSEPETISDDDAYLAEAIEKNRRVVLPVLVERTSTGLQTTLPLSPFKTAARGLGHTHFTFDADGVVRSVFLQESLQDTAWPQFAVSIFNVGRDVQDGHVKAGSQDVEKLRTDGFTTGHYAPDSLLHHHFLERIPFAGPPGHFSTVSYIDVLSGRIPPSFFDGKYVLIGATAAGIASMFPTPVTTEQRVMSGIEVNANILAGLIEKRGIRDAARWEVALFTVIAAFAALFVCRYFSPFSALGMTAALLCFVSLATYAIFLAEIWLPPGAALLMVIAVYPLWNWRRLEAALTYLGEEFSRLNQDATMVLRQRNETGIQDNSDFLDRQINAIRLAADHSRDMHQFVIDNLNSMPDATLVLSQKIEMLMYNRTASEYFKTIGLNESNGPPDIYEIFSHFDQPMDAGIRRTWCEVLLHPTEGGRTAERETRDVNGREFLIKSAPSRMEDGTTLGWIISLIDVTSLRAAERRREESLNFISHDMRVPQSSILALIQLQKNPATAFAMPEFLSRIERSVETTLNLAENFVHLAKAESQAYQFQETDFASMLAEAADNMWAFAHSKSIDIVVDAQTDNLWLNVDRSLVVRALGNLLSNAIKFSPEDSRVICTARPAIRSGGNYVRCCIADQGQGIDPSKHDIIFSPFLRADEQGRDGVGLGLAFVKMVIERHGGKIDLTSAPGAGSAFSITLPCMIEPVEA
ncbi:MAG TPA: CHASE2 domain-containing protein [Oxalicibacterium sp.]|uniref:CHASE2 domain-containing protein n=1 Tax=Oxalicibacterium sp. TaxID=2766525 RepID=UPI002BE4BB92|nr:CHASE2 domain-containing protein [Oxalicibacterium sp.]HWU99197.1 CHASE2 domain-containing protein [Oxalicibacterium sp.]